MFKMVSLLPSAVEKVLPFNGFFNIFIVAGGGQLPRSFSGKLVAIAYWLFVVLTVNTFTANLAAFSCRRRMAMLFLQRSVQRLPLNNAPHSYPLKKFISRERAILKKKEDPKQSTVLLARVLEIRHEDSTAMSYPPRLNGAEVFRSAW